MHVELMERLRTLAELKRGNDLGSVALRDFVRAELEARNAEAVAYAKGSYLLDAGEILDLDGVEG